MARVALALLLLASTLLATLPAPAGAQTTPAGATVTVPTQQEVDVGSLHITTWVMGDTRAALYSPDKLSNPLAVLWNTNFTAGALGLVYAKAVARDTSDNATAYQFVASIASSSGYVTFATGNFSGAVETPRWQADHVFNLTVGGASPPGDVTVTLHLESWRVANGTSEPEAAKDLTISLHVAEPAPAFAQTKGEGTVTLYAWVSGGSITTAKGASGCLGGPLTPENHNVTGGSYGVACFIAVQRGDPRMAVNVTVEAPAAVTVLAPAWQSGPFNATTGGMAAPVNGFVLIPQAGAAPGPATVRFHYALSSVGPGNATAPLASGTLDAPMVVEAGQAATLKGQVNWIAQAPVLVATIGGLGYLATTQRRVKVQPRSKALREMKRGKRGEGAEPAQAAVTEAQVEEQRQAAQEAAWDKKRKILDAKREDILRSIQIAEERKQRGEITEHVFNGIKERKERQLEQVEREMEELR